MIVNDKDKLTLDDYKGREIPLLNFERVSQFDSIPFNPYKENHREYFQRKSLIYQHYKSSNLSPLRLYSDTRGDKWVSLTLPGKLQLLAPASLKTHKAIKNDSVTVAELFQCDHLYVGELIGWTNQFSRMKSVDRKNVPKKYLRWLTMSEVAKKEVSGLAHQIDVLLPGIEYNHISEFLNNNLIKVERVSFRDFQGGAKASARIDLKDRTMYIYDYTQMGCFNYIKWEF